MLMCQFLGTMWQVGPSQLFYTWYIVFGTEPLHGGGAADSKIFLGSEHEELAQDIAITLYIISKTFVRATRPTRPCTSPITNTLVKLLCQPIAPHLKSSTDQIGQKRLAQKVQPLPHYREMTPLEREMLTNVIVRFLIHAAVEATPLLSIHDIAVDNSS